MSVTYLICRLHNMKQQINSPFSCHHRKFATRLQTHHVLRISRQKSGICCSLSFTRLSFRMRRRLKFFTAHFVRNFRGFFPEFWRRCAGRNQESRPCGFGIKNQARCAARNQESRPLRGPESRIKNHCRGLTPSPSRSPYRVRRAPLDTDIIIEQART